MDFLITHSPALIVALPLVAAFAIPLINRAGHRARNTFSLVIFGLILILVMIYLPRGLHEPLSKVYHWFLDKLVKALNGGEVEKQ